MRGIRKDSVKTLAQLDSLQPEDRWIVYVEDCGADYYYDGDKKTWIEINNASSSIIRYDDDNKVASNKILFETLDINEIIVFSIIGICLILSIVMDAKDVASVLAGVLAGRGVGVNGGKNNTTINR